MKLPLSSQPFKQRKRKMYGRRTIDSDAANELCAAANAPVPGGFAGFLAARRFIDNADINKAKAETIDFGATDQSRPSDLGRGAGPQVGRLASFGNSIAYKMRPMLVAVLLVVAAMLVNGAGSCLAVAKADGHMTTAQTARASEKAVVENDAQQKFLRLTRNQAGEPAALEVAIVRFVKSTANGDDASAVVVDLIGAIHIGEPAYYDCLNDEFKNYDDVLFELVASDDAAVAQKAAGENRHPVALVQKIMTGFLDLEYQLDGVDYNAKNFVHADMSPEQFRKSMQDRGESFLGMFLRALGYAMTRPGGSSPSANDIGLFVALFDEDRALALKRVLASQFQDMGGMMAVFDGPNGSTLISARNEVALEVLRCRLAAGSRKVAIFYGAGHMNDMAKRLEEEFGMQPQNTRWLRAWDLSPK